MEPRSSIHAVRMHLGQTPATKFFGDALLMLTGVVS